MVIVEYFPRASLLCADESAQPRHDAERESYGNTTYTINNNTNAGYDDALSTSTRAKSLSRKRSGILWATSQLLKGSVNLVNSSVQQLRDGLTEEERRAKAQKEERRQILALRMKNATTREQWKAAAKELDIVEENEIWKQDTFSNEFDVALIAARTKELDTARINCDVKSMLNLLRTALSRDLGGMGNVRLYQHSHIGTKYLIERYVESTRETIQALVEMTKHTLPDGIEAKDVLEQVVYARQAFGRSALLLSGGATFGMNHVGVLKALFEERLLPRIISGASAGSIVCAVLCTRTDEEIPGVLDDFPYGDLAVFEEQGHEDGILEKMRRLLTQGAWIDIKHLTRVMRDLLGDITFQEAYNRTRRILNICVSSASLYELPRLLNYATAPNVMIWSAVAASCSVPVLFSAAQLLVKKPITLKHEPWNPTPQHWIDGSVDNDLPMTRLAEMFNVNHFIVSQVNPHVVPFLVKDDSLVAEATLDDDPGPGWIYTLTNLAKDEAIHRMHVLAELGIFPNLVTKCKSVLSQKYSGDITILPEIDYKDFGRILTNPTPDFMVQACLSGERATWPKVSRIKNHCAIELELDSAVQKLRARVVFSPSQVNLRRMTTKEGGGRGLVKRRDSSGNFQFGHFYSESVPEKTSAGSLTRAVSSNWTTSQRYMPPAGQSIESPGTAPSLPHPDFAPLTMRAPHKHNKVSARQEISSAGDTSYSPGSSDADVDSTTDDSSPEMRAIDASHSSSQAIAIPSRLDPEQGDIDFFSNTQPITSSVDHLLATSPVGSRTSLEALSPDSKETPSHMNQSKEGNTNSISKSSPEMRYKKLFHQSTKELPRP